VKSIWPVKKLSEVAEIQMGQSPKGTSYNTYGEGVPLINGPVEFGETPFSHTRKTKFTTEPTKFCKAGDLILCVRASAGRMNIAGYDSCIGRGVAAIRSKEHQEWINFFIYSNRENIYRLGSGSTFPNVSRATLSKIEIPIPPKNEQKRIVAILNEVFEGVDRAIANTERKLAALKELGQSILQKALADAEELPAGWEVKALDELCEIARGGSPRPIRQFLTDNSDGVNWIKIGDASASSKYIYDTKERIKPEGIKHSRLVHEGDLLLSNSMSFGRPYIMRTSGCIHDGWLVLKDRSGVLNQDYLYYFLGSKAAYRQFDSLAAGSTVRNLNINLVKTVEVTIPPLSKQKQIVAILDEVFEGIDRAIANTKRKLAALAELKQSILQKAFSGELTGPTANQVTKEVEGAIA